MRIIHLSAEKTWRGGEQQLAYLIKELSILGFQQLVVCRENSAFEKYCIEQNIPHKSLKMRHQFDVASSYKLKKISKDFDASLIHLHSSHAHALAVWAYYVGNKVRLVLSRKVDFPISSNFLSNIKYNCSKISHIICVSNAIAEIIKPAIKNPEKIRVVYDGIDLDAFTTTSAKNLRDLVSIPSEIPIIINTSALADHKDYPTFLSFAKKLLEKMPAKFLVFGDGPLKAEIKNRSENLGLAEHVHFMGFNPHVRQLLPSADYFVMTSKTEGLGSSILDAYAAKVPVIATAAGGIQEIVVNEKTGLLCPIGDANQLAEAVVKLHNNQDLKNKIVQQASKFVASFSYQEMAKNTATVYWEQE